METTIKYIKEKHLKLTQEEILELFNDREANADKIMRSQMAMVMHLAQRYYFKDSSKTFDELVSDGMMGVLKAIKYYDPINNPGVDFSAFCWTSVKQCLFEYRNTGDVIRKPKSNKQEYEVLTAYNFSTFDPAFLEVHQPSEKQEEIQDVSSSEVCKVIKDVLNNERYSDIIIATFGFCDVDKLTYDEMGEIYGISRQRVQQIRKFALAKLKENDKFVKYLKNIVI